MQIKIQINESGKRRAIVITNGECSYRFNKEFNSSEKLNAEIQRLKAMFYGLGMSCEVFYP